MKRIFKYQLPILEEVELRLPIDAEVVRIDDLDGMIWLWAIIDDEAKDDYLFDEMPDDRREASMDGLVGGLIHEDTAWRLS